MRRAGFVLVAAALMLVVLLPAAQSTHTYGHRYLVMGRVLDEAGNPVQQEAVTMTTQLGSTMQARMQTVTDCQGSFFSPDSRVETAQGLYEQSQADGKVYFHYHDAELSSRIDVELSVMGESWTEGFNPDTRYTPVRHQLAQATEAKEGCGGGYDEFNTTFTLHVSMFTDRETQTNSEDVVNQRPMNATLTHAGGNQMVNATTDISGNAFFAFQNVSVQAGDTIVVRSEAIDDQTITLDADDATYMWHDETYKIQGDPGPLVGSGIRNFLILLAVVVVIVLAYVGYQKMRQQQELKKAYQQTERKRARRKP